MRTTIANAIAVPAEGDDFKPSSQQRCKCYSTKKQDGYVYVRLADNPSVDFEPFAMHHYRQTILATSHISTELLQELKMK